MVFERDIFMPVSADIDWEQIRIRKQARIRKIIFERKLKTDTTHIKKVISLH
jgi:hypothetical protein